jgi:hypothetical protein
MNPSESKENLVFDYHTIRLLVGLIAFFLPWIVIIFASGLTPSISWSYHTNARNFFVGLLFVIGAFMMSYKGHKHPLEKDVGKFWKWVGNFWKGGIKFRKVERKHEEDLVGWVGGFAAWVAAVFPTTKCVEEVCPSDPISTIHIIGAIILFSTTVYYCLVAFRGAAKSKINNGESGNEPIKLRIRLYSFCGWGIVAIMLSLGVAKFTHFDAISNITFLAETAALVLFGIGWMTASQYLFCYPNKP